ncbi:MAG: ADOP family duplicated permease [Gemmatimonadaceae bacterium]
MSDLWFDARYAVRSFTRRPNRVATLVAMAALALGIAATTAIFSFVEAVLIRPLPFAEPQQIVSVQLTTRERRGSSAYGSLAPWDLYEAWRARARAIGSLAAYRYDAPILSGLGQTRRVPAIGVTSNLFSFLGVSAARGRGFSPTDDNPGAPRIAVLSAKLWRSAFNADPGVLGRTITLDGQPYEIIGIMPEGFRVPFSVPEVRKDQPEVWLPIGVARAFSAGRPLLVNVLGRLRDSATPVAAQAELDRIIEENRASLPPGPGSVGSVAQISSLTEVITHRVRKPLLLLLGMAGLLLAIATANVASLLLARAIARRRELTMRAALGAGTPRLVRQLLTESVALAVAGGVVGVAIAYAAVPVLLSLIGDQLPADTPLVGVNALVLIAAFALMVLVGIVAGLIPSLQVVRGPSFATLKDASAGSGSRASSARLASGLVVGQIGLTVILLTGMGSLAAGFSRLMNEPRGYDSENVLVAAFMLPRERYATRDEQLRFASSVLDRVRAIPGVATAAVGTGAPIVGGVMTTVTMVNGNDAKGVEAHTWGVSPEYLRTLGVQMARGAGLDGTVASSNGVVIDEAAARRLFGTADPIGQRLGWTVGGTPVTGTVVGLARNVHELPPSGIGTTTAKDEPHVYVPFEQGGGRVLRLVVRSSGGDAARLAAPVRAAIAELERNTPMDVLATLKQLTADRFARERFLATLAEILGAVALIIAAAGIYAIVAQAVARRTREMGIRLALGAGNGHVIRQTMRRGVVVALAGTIVGVVLAVLTGRFLESVLFGVSLTNPAMLGAAVAIIVAAALLASYGPARRATRTDPVSVLRDQ